MKIMGMVDYERALKDYKYDIRILLIHLHHQEVEALIRTGYYYRVEHLVNKYTSDGEYLINVEIFPKLIVLQRVSPVDNFKTVLQDKITI